MSTRRDYVPHNAAQFNAFMRNLLQYVETMAAGWGHIPADKVSSLVALYETFLSAFEAASVPNAPHPQVLARQEAQAACTEALRAFVNQYLRFAPVTNVDRAEMGVPNHDKTPTAHTVVTERVASTVRPEAEGQLRVDFWQEGAAHKAKPEGYDGAVTVWGIVEKGHIPANPDDLPHHAMASRTPFILHFDGAERGKEVAISMAWQNERGILGPWSPIMTAIIP